MFERYRAAAMTYIRPATSIPMAALLMAVLFPILTSSPPYNVKYITSIGLMFVLLEASFLAYHVKEQIANYRSTVMPRFCTPHIVVALTFSLVLILLHTLLLGVFGASILGALAIFSMCLATGLWVHHFHPGVIGVVLLVGVASLVGTLVLIPIVDKSSNSYLYVIELILSGSPAPATTTLILSIVVIAGWVVRLMHLNEEMFEYHLKLPFTESDQKAQRDRIRANEQPPGMAARFDRLRGYVGSGTWKRVRHWQLGNAPTTWILTVLCITLFVVYYLVTMATGIPKEYDGTPIPGGFIGFALFVFFLPYLGALRVVGRGCDLGYESLRPCSKPQLVRELGLAAALDMFTAWAMLIVVWGLTIAIWNRVAITPLELLVIILFSIGGNVFLFGVTAWLMRFHSLTLVVGGELAVGGGVLTVFALGFTLLTFVLRRELLSLFPAWATLSMLLGLAGVLLAWYSYRKWCETELG
ncbi:MAG: hypothetical protein KAY37_00535 [Phycisphaerae bacterium]|nr:hypothetical protein [Phycisphaerae bacterium]